MHTSKSIQGCITTERKSCDMNARSVDAHDKNEWGSSYIIIRCHNVEAVCMDNRQQCCTSDAISQVNTNNQRRSFKALLHQSNHQDGKGLVKSGPFGRTMG